ncbi:hydrogenase formation protein HypD [bacterium]|nr:hydrogenase formation protein HypD [bacterium]
MKYIDEFRSGKAAGRLKEEIAAAAAGRPMTFMEVCGTHTMSIARNGIREMLPAGMRLISGPGCPVCVTPNGTIDHAVALARHPGIIIATFGDMVKVPGSTSSLGQERAAGRSVRVVASTLDALELARNNPEMQVVFIGVGFETTAPTIAASIITAEQENLNNYSVLSAHKVVPPAMELLCRGRVAIDGFLCPGHVSAVIGSSPYRPIAEEHGIACVIGGFEGLDILQSIAMLARQVAGGDSRVEIQYRRVVRPEGNPAAVALMEKVFRPVDSVWRGIGMITASGLVMRDAYRRYDAAVRFPVTVEETKEAAGCICGSVLQGISDPRECPLFGDGCLPETPVGPCMVSSEGACAAAFRYRVSRRADIGQMHDA